jgi:hypothetical protein
MRKKSRTGVAKKLQPVARPFAELRKVFDEQAARQASLIRSLLIHYMTK